MNYLITKNDIDSVEQYVTNKTVVFYLPKEINLFGSIIDYYEYPLQVSGIGKNIFGKDNNEIIPNNDNYGFKYNVNCKFITITGVCNPSNKVESKIYPYVVNFLQPHLPIQVFTELLPPDDTDCDRYHFVVEPSLSNIIKFPISCNNMSKPYITTYHNRYIRN